jgi:hypothetical protein
MLPTVTAKELKDAMPQFREEAVQKQVREEGIFCATSFLPDNSHRKKR